MKHLLKTALAAIVMLVIAGMSASAQNAQNPMLQPLPVDKDVRIGKLPNGLTYYIRHNEFPKGQADFYIAQKVGSALEEENQRGLAHFLEHMCFNGTTNFPGSQLRDWLESIGVKFGANLNAYTSIDETVYNISNVPVARESVQDSCLLILHDWANDLTLDPEEINKERGVIHEEWRQSMQGQMRIFERILPDLFPTTKYGRRLPIGIMEVVDNFEPQALRDYYETWYRPDQQAIIVVGDIDVDRIEGKIKEMFTSIEMPENAKPRLYEQVPDHKGTLYGIGSDPEQKSLTAQLLIMQENFPKDKRDTPAYFASMFINTMISSMLNNRLSDIASKPDAPFASAGFGFTDYVITGERDAVGLSTISKDTDIITPLQAAYRELLRAARGGFTQSEYDRARDNYLSAYERAYNNRATRESGTFVKEYVRNFIDGEAIPDIDTEWQIVQRIANNVPLEVLNQTIAKAITPDNRAMIVLSPEKEGYVLPTPAQLEKALADIDAETIEAFVDNVKNEPLIAKAPVPGKIVKTEENPVWGTTEWTLSNGIKVIVKQTKFKEDEIMFAAQAMGGYSECPAEYAPTILALPGALGRFGLGSYSSSELRKYLSGKMAGVGLSISGYRRAVSGNSTPKDLPTLMELIYMAFTDVQFDKDEFEAMQKSSIAMLSNQVNDPNYIFNKNLDETLYTSPFSRTLTADDIRNASRELTTKLVHEMTSNAADFTFFFVGNIDLEKLRPLVETYIASLPADAAKARKTVGKYNPGMFAKKGSGDNSFSTAMATPQTLAAVLSFGDIDFTPKNSQIASIAGQIMTNRLIKTVREEMGAVYSIGAAGQLSRMGLNPAMISTSFPMKPEMKKEVLDFIRGQFKAMESDVTEEELAPIKEYMAKSFVQGKERNGMWMSALTGYDVNGVDTFNGNVDVLNSITVNDIMDFMKALNAQGNYRTITLDPAE